MQHCKKCLYTSSHPLSITFDKNGICSGCRVHEEKNFLNWNERLILIKKLVNKYKSKSNKNYDCIVPVTGGNDSYFILHLVKNILGLNPLLVNYNKYYNTKIGIKNLSNLRIKFDCDILIQNINPNSVKKITKTTLRELSSLYWHVIAGQTAFPVQVAVTHKIPLIIWGAHQGMEQVGMFSHLDEVQMSRRYRKEHDLMGFEADDLLNVFDTLKESDIWQYRYPDRYDIDRNGIIGIYLNNFFRWDPKTQHEFVIKKYNYKTIFQSRTFYPHDHMDCFNYMNLHDKLKMAKCGYSKVTDHVCREIRHGRITREDAKLIVKFYENKEIKYSNLFCEWLGISTNGLEYILNQMFNNRINKKLFKDNKNKIPKNIKKTLGQYKATELSYMEADNYVIFGKGYP